MNSGRRNFISSASKAAMTMAILPIACTVQSEDKEKKANANQGFDISLAQWSIRDMIRSGKISNLEFPETAKNMFDIHAVEYVSSFFDGKETDQSYLKELKQRGDDLNVKNVLIMVDMWGPEGVLASPVEAERRQAASNHHKWVDAAAFLGCHAIRVNASGYGDSSYQDARDYFADGLSRLVEYGARNNISIIVENHGGYSSNGNWLAEVMKKVDHVHCGTLPDFGNFQIDKEAGIFYDPLKGLSQLMHYAKGVSAKSNDFDMHGYETTIDYPAMMAIVKRFGFNGYVGIEFGGGSLTPAEEGIKKTKTLLEKLRKEYYG
ncbi:MAG: sugar phosphate isomerase/epimerase family protein [Cyclobacteriaceae bacterium]